jgi:hypothetical protein
VAPPYSFSDSFQRSSNTTTLGANWTTVAGAIGVTSNKAVPSGTVAAYATVNGSSIADVALAVTVDLTKDTDGAALIARYATGGAKMYQVGVSRSSGTCTVKIQVKQSTWATLASAAAPTCSGTVAYYLQGPSHIVTWNGAALVSIADASVTASGAVGVGASNAGTELSDFTADAIVSANVALPFSGTFQTSDSPTLGGILGGAWAPVHGQPGVKSDAAISESTGTVIGVLNGVSTDDISLTADVSVGTATSDCAELVARYQGPGGQNYYSAGLCGAKAYLYKNLAGTVTALGSVAVSSEKGTLVFSVQGHSLTLSLGGTAILGATDTSLASGEVGVLLAGNGTISDFSAAANPLNSVNLPFAASFAGPSLSLGPDWLAFSGLLEMKGSDAINTTTTGFLSVLNRVSVANVTQSVTYTGMADNDSVGVVARYAASSKPNAYWGGIGRSSTGTTSAYLYKLVAGTWTMITDAAISGNPTAGTMTFSCDGTTLTLTFNNKTILTEKDTAISAAGTVGLHGAGKSVSISAYSATAE